MTRGEDGPLRVRLVHRQLALVGADGLHADLEARLGATHVGKALRVLAHGRLFFASRQPAAASRPVTSTAAGWVVDASALLAHLLAEPGGDVVRDTLAGEGAVISAVNWSEALSKLAIAGEVPGHLARRLLADELLADGSNSWR